jgi:hypothetical protein
LSVTEAPARLAAARTLPSTYFNDGATLERLEVTTRIPSPVAWTTARLLDVSTRPGMSWLMPRTP